MGRKFYKPLAKLIVFMNKEGILDFDWENRYFMFDKIVEDVTYENVGKLLSLATPAEQERAYADLSSRYSEVYPSSAKINMPNFGMTPAQLRGAWDYRLNG